MQRIADRKNKDEDNDGKLLKAIKLDNKKMFDIYADFSRFYDLYVGGWLEDLPFYLEYARDLSTPLLEVGAGSGRLTIPFARAGYSVVAVDISASMLVILKSRLMQEAEDVRKRVEIVEADAKTLKLGDKYELIIVPFFTFNYFLTSQAQKAALKRLAQHLTDSGTILFDVFIPFSRIKECSPEPVLRVDTVEAETGNKIRGWNIYSMDLERQIECRRHIFEVAEPNGTVSKKEFITKRRYTFRPEIEQLFSGNGLFVESVFSNYNKEMAGPDSERLVYVLGRK